jgi:flagellin
VSLRAQRQLSLSTDGLSKTYERLSSGLRITRASDDAAGLAIADSLRTDARIASVAVRNANDGISALNIADGALNEISNVLQRMGEIAEQSANGTYRSAQRSPLQAEFLALASEIERIATVTNFNSIRLLSDSSQLFLQVGFNAASTSQIQFNTIRGTLSGIFLAAGNSSMLSYSVIANTDLDSQNAARTALDAVMTAIQNVSVGRGSIGAAQSRLNVAINNINSTRENLIAAESRIRDADVATEVADMVRQQILQQAGRSVLAQANQQPALALRLLRID